MCRHHREPRHSHRLCSREAAQVFFADAGIAEVPRGGGSLTDDKEESEDHNRGRTQPRPSAGDGGSREPRLEPSLAADQQDKQNLTGQGLARDQHLAGSCGDQNPWRATAVQGVGMWEGSPQHSLADAEADGICEEAEAISRAVLAAGLGMNNAYR